MIHHGLRQGTVGPGRNDTLTLGDVMRLLCLMTILCGITLPSHASPLYLSTTSSATLEDTRFRSGDISALDQVYGDAYRVWVETFVRSENINALHALDEHRIIFSTSTDGVMESGLAFQDGDLLLLDVLTGETSTYLSESLFSGANEDIDALYVYPDGRIALSGTSTMALGGLHWGSDDVALYDPVADLAALILDGGETFDRRENVDALHLLEDGSMLLSSSTDFAIGGVSYLDADVIRFDPLSGHHELFLPEARFGTNEDVDALTLVPTLIQTPGTAVLLGLGLPLVVVWRFKRSGDLCLTGYLKSPGGAD